ncbi:MAG: hypothetical protein ACHQXA_08285 [Gemmatimonadales bacterium]
MPAPISPQARQYRVAMWLLTVVAVAALVPAVQGIRGAIPQPIGLAAGGIAVAAFVLGGRFGLRGIRIAREQRERDAARTALVLMAGMLRRQSDAQLEAFATREGEIGEAARLLLERRRDDARRASPTRPGPA